MATIDASPRIDPRAALIGSGRASFSAVSPRPDRYASALSNMAQGEIRPNKKAL